MVEKVPNEENDAEAMEEPGSSIVSDAPNREETNKESSKEGEQVVEPNEETMRKSGWKH